jgi:uncharacterized alpha-E superfamily protein
MLSRVANSLYWMVRYIERADNLARLIEVNERLLLDVGSVASGRPDAFWRSILASTGDDEAFDTLVEEGEVVDVVRFLIEDPRNPNSIRSCVSQARENARMVRDQLSESLWEEINALYLFLNSPGGSRWFDSNPSHFYETIRRATYSFHGIAAATLMRGEAWDFMELGRYLERADKTTRFLDITHFLPETGDEGIDRLQAILSSCGGLAAFRELYKGALEAANVNEFLIFEAGFPRSVVFCMDRVDASLHRISGTPRGSYGDEVERASGRLLGELAYGSVEDVNALGLHQYLDGLQTRFNEIGEAIFRSYVLLPETSDERPMVPPSSARAVMDWQIQQQQQ